MIPKHLKQSLRHLRQIDPKLDAFFRRPRTPAALNSIQLQQKHDLGLLEDPVQHESPTWAQLALSDIQHYFGKGPIEQ